MPNQYSRITKDNILRKMNRRNPVSSVTELAREFGVNTAYTRSWGGNVGHAAPLSFRNKVKALVGERKYKQLRRDKNVNLSYR